MRIVMLLIGLSCLASLPVRSDAADPPQKIKPLMVWSEVNSAHKQRGYERCATNDSWRPIWHKYRGKAEFDAGRTRPKIDFDTHMLITMFGGSDELTCEEVIEETEIIRVRFWVVTYQTGLDPSDADSDILNYKVNGFLVVMLPKSNKPLVIEEGHRNDLVTPFTWKECARFPASKTK